jgi:hypothetical protein
MIAKIIREDEASYKLSHLPKFHETFQPHDANIEENTQKFQHEMKNRNKEKINTILFCEKVLKEAERQAELESIALIDQFTSVRKHKFRQLQAVKDGEHFNYAAFKKELHQIIDRLEDDLMGVELKLQESLSAATVDFQDRVRRIIDDMKTKTSSYIAEVNQEMEQFSVVLKVYAMQEFDRFANMAEDNANDENNAIADELVELMAEADELNTILEQSKEKIESKINDIESQITRDLNNDWKQTEARIIEAQH